MNIGASYTDAPPSIAIHTPLEAVDPSPPQPYGGGRASTRVTTQQQPQYNEPQQEQTRTGTGPRASRGGGAQLAASAPETPEAKRMSRLQRASNAMNTINSSGTAIPETP